jgi:hypothetical protein
MHVAPNEFASFVLNQMVKLYMSITEELREFLIGRREFRKIPSEMEIDDIYMHVSQHNALNPQNLINVSLLLKDSVVLRREKALLDPNLTEMQLMRLKAGERKYQKTIENVSTQKISKAEKSEFKDASESVAFASHFIVAFVSAFLLGYYLGDYIFEFSATEYKYMLGGACSFATLILESALFIIREQKKELAASKKTQPFVFSSSQPPGSESQMISVGEQLDEATLRKRQLR